MPENEIARFTKEALNPREFIGTALVLTFISSPGFLGMFYVLGQSESPWASYAAYGALFLWGFVDLILLAWSKAKLKGGTTSDIAARLILRSGWQLRQIPLQLITGILIIAFPLLIIIYLTGPPILSPPIETVIPIMAFFWLVSVPIETWLQSWIWPMALPFGPISAQIAFLFLHGLDRALDPRFAFVALSLGFAFWILTYLRYVNIKRYYLFGPVTAWSAHATWNSFLLFVPLTLPFYFPGG